MNRVSLDVEGTLNKVCQVISGRDNGSLYFSRIGAIATIHTRIKLSIKVFLNASEYDVPINLLKPLHLVIVTISSRNKGRKEAKTGGWLLQISSYLR